MHNLFGGGVMTVSCAMSSTDASATEMAADTWRVIHELARV
jgi:hypothetical protein